MTDTAANPVDTIRAIVQDNPQREFVRNTLRTLSVGLMVAALLAVLASFAFHLTLGDRRPYLDLVVSTAAVELLGAVAFFLVFRIAVRDRRQHARLGHRLPVVIMAAISLTLFILSLEVGTGEQSHYLIPSMEPFLSTVLLSLSLEGTAALIVWLLLEWADPLIVALGQQEALLLQALEQLETQASEADRPSYETLTAEKEYLRRELLHYISLETRIMAIVAASDCSIAEVKLELDRGRSLIERVSEAEVQAIIGRLLEGGRIEPVGTYGRFRRTAHQTD